MAGQPVLPYNSVKSYQGMDVFVDLAFLDHTQSAVTPTSLVYQIDDITNAVNMVPQTSVAGLAPTMLVQLPGARFVMTHEWLGSQLCQVEWSMTAIDSVTGQPFTAKRIDIIELCSIQTPGAGS